MPRPQLTHAQRRKALRDTFTANCTRIRDCLRPYTPSAYGPAGEKALRSLARTLTPHQIALLEVAAGIHAAAAPRERNGDTNPATPEPYVEQS